MCYDIYNAIHCPNFFLRQTKINYLKLIYNAMYYYAITFIILFIIICFVHYEVIYF